MMAQQSAKAKAPGRSLAAPVGLDKDAFVASVGQIKTQLLSVAATGLDYDKLVQVAWWTLRSNPLIAECSRESFLGALYLCARYGLYPDIRGHAWIIPRRTGPPGGDGRRGWEAHFQVGYQGWRKLALRSGMIERVEAHPVREGDQFGYAYGSEPYIDHRPCRDRETPLCAAYAIAWFKDSTRFQFEVCESFQVTPLRDRVLAEIPEAKRKYSPWVQWEAEMWRKMPLIRLCKDLPLEIDDIQEAAAYEGLTASGQSQLTRLDDVVGTQPLDAAQLLNQKDEDDEQHKQPKE